MSIEKNESVNAKPINDGIHNLKYDPRKILAFKGSDVSGIPETEAVDKGGVCYVTTNTKHTFTSNYDVAVSSAIKDVTYPGALVKANSKLVEGAPDPYVFDRRGMKVTIDLPGLGDKNTRLVNEISYGTVSAAVDGLIEDWVKECADEHGISSNMNYIRSIMYDENLTALKFGCDVGYLKQKLGIDFNMIRDQKKSSYMIMFKQVFYTVSVKPPVNPADPFADNVTWNDLTVGGVNDENPPAYVRNVEYGRQIFFVMESSLSSSELEALVNGCVTVEGVSCHVDLDAKYKEQAKKVHCKITTLGGTAVMIDGSLADEEILNQLNKLICENTQLSLKNPGAPLNYTTAFLKDNEVAVINATTDYITSETIARKSGEIALEHTGWYVAKFFVTWEEVTCEKGVRNVKKCSWCKNGDHLTAPFSTVIPIPYNATNICIRAEEQTGLIWEGWRVVCDKKNLSFASKIYVHIYGTTLNQKYEFHVDP